MRDTSIPSFLIPQDSVSINITISGTDAVVEDQGITYNQAGMTYNQAGIMYGGVYNTDEDIVPLDLTFSQTIPVNMSFSDLYTPYVPVAPNHGMLIGILGLTYP